MKKILKVGIIFLLFIQMLNLNIVWAGDEDNSDKITIYLSFVNGIKRIREVRRVVVSKGQKVSDLDKIVNEKVQYILSGMILNENLKFGDIIKENDLVVAVPYEDDRMRMWMRMSKDNELIDKLQAHFFVLVRKVRYQG